MKTNLLHNLSRGMILAMSGWLLAACSDSPMAPASGPAIHQDAFSAVAAKSSSNKVGRSSKTTTTRNTSGTAVSVLKFNASVNTSVSVSKVIGPAGGMVLLPQTGFSLVVPAGAVLLPTTFTVTPVGGSLVAYNFEPHGTAFAVPLLFMQDLSKTNYQTGMSVRGAYFADPSLIDPEAETAEISEIFTLSFDGFGLSFFSIKHFSGYLVSMG